MKKQNIFIFGIVVLISALAFAGCQTGSSTKTECAEGCTKACCAKEDAPAAGNEEEMAPAAGKRSSE